MAREVTDEIKNKVSIEGAVMIPGLPYRKIKT